MRQSEIRNPRQFCISLIAAYSSLPLLQFGFSQSTSAQQGIQSPGGTDLGERGLLINDARASQGFTLFAPMNSTHTYLIDMDGNVVRTWTSELRPSGWVYLTEDGFLWRGGRERETHGFNSGGSGGRFQKFTLDGALVWDFSLDTADLMPHHDVAILPNGNILAAAWAVKGEDETIGAGRRESFVPPGGIWDDGLIELQPLDNDAAKIVWEWRVWDHLIQTYNPLLPAYSNPSEHPELIDINGDNVGVAVAPNILPIDVFHINSVDYNAAFGQILLSSPTFNEVWIIEHSASTAEASGHSGGRYGKGGDLLYRWGNPQAYGRGGPDERLIGFQHDAGWIPSGYSGYGNILLFSNRAPYLGTNITKVIEFDPSMGADGSYLITRGQAFGPAQPAWEYSEPRDFRAAYLSGAQRLSNGNTLITSGPEGRIFEIDASGNIVWEYKSTFPEVDNDPEGLLLPPSFYAIFRATRISIDYPGLEGLR